MFFNSYRHAVLCGSAAAVLTAFAAPAAAYAQEATYSFNIPSQDLGNALRAYARAARQQLVFDNASIRGKRNPALVGTFTADDGLRRLLEGSGLEVRRTPAGVIYLEAAAGERSLGETEKANVVDEFVVTGTYIQNATPTSPVITVNRADIERGGFTSVQDVMAKIPQNFSGVNSSSAPATGGNVGFTSQVDLHGLGAEATLTLINGRRVTGASGDDGRAVDIGMIPVSAVERIDVLTDGASALYGSDAIGGVVNVILRKNFEGAETSVQYGRDRGGADDYTFSQLLGASWRGGHMLASAQYRHADALSSASLGLDTQDLRAFGGGDFRITGLGAPGNVFPYPGAFLGAPFNNVTGPGGTPVFVASLPGGDGRALSLSQLGLNQLTPFDYPIEDFVPETTDLSAYLTVEQQVGPITLFADGVYSKRSFVLRQGPELVSMIVPASNAFSPFGEDVFLTYPLRELGPLRFEPEDEGGYFNIGARGGLGYRDWTWELVGSASRDRMTRDLETVQSIPPALLASSDPATAFNPFGDGTGQSPGVIDNLQLPLVNRAVTEMEGWSLHSQGALFDLPGGALRLAVGAEQRWESLSSEQIFAGVTRQSFPGAKRSSYAVFGELYAPFVGSENAMPGIQELALSAAARYERYSDFGETVNPKIGLLWRPLQDLQLKANWGTSFRAPSLRELYQVQSLQPLVGTFDPNAPGGPAFVFVPYLTGGNPSLKEETADTYTISAAYQPAWLDGARMTLTYFHVDYDNRIRGPLDGITAGTLLQYESSLPAGVVERSPGGPGNPPAGTLTQLNIININSAKTVQSGYDFGVGYRWNAGQAGDFDLSLSGSYLDRYDDQLVVGAPILDLRGKVGNPPKWRGRFGAVWSKRPFGAALFVNYIGSFYNDDPDPRIVRRDVDSQITVDTQLSFTAPDSGSPWSQGLSAQIGVNNLFDKRPPFVDGNRQGVDLQNAIVQGRTVYIRLSKKFGIQGE